MALYEFFCPTCRVQFEERRPMSESSSPVFCKEGHIAERRISSFAVTRVAGSLEPVDVTPTGACCAGGACACSAN